MTTSTQRPGSRIRRFVVVTAVLALVAAACSGGEGATTDPPVKEAVEVQTTDTEPTDEGVLVILGEQIADQALWSAARAEGTVSIYTTNPEEKMIELLTYFTEDTGISASVFRGPGAELSQRILAEAAAGVFEWDVVGHTSPGDMIDFKERGLIIAHKVPHDHDRFVASGEIDSEYFFYPFGGWLYIPAYNTAVVAETIETWEDLLNPAFKGLAGHTPATVGGTGFAQALFHQEVLGDEWLIAFGETEPIFFSSTVTVADNLGRGELGVATGAESVFAPQVSAGAPVKLVYPKEGIIGGVSYTAIGKNAKNPNAAKVFQNWYISQRGQNVSGEIGAWRAVRDDAGPLQLANVDFPPLAELNVFWSNLADRVDERDAVVGRWTQLVGYLP